MSTDSGIDLVVYSLISKQPNTVQFKTNFRPKPGGGAGKAALDWWMPDDSPAELVALVDLSEQRVWMLTLDELGTLAQQHSNGRYHIYMYTDPTATPRSADRAVHVYEFQRYLLENRAHTLFGV